MAFRRLADLASRALGGSVVAANDESFAAKENLITPGRAVFDPEAFGHTGKVYDGWETRRRREPGDDSAVVRLGAPGIVHGVVVDTAHFRGNYPPEVSVEAACVEGYPSPAELAGAVWRPLVPRSAVGGDRENPFPVTDSRRWTHVRLRIHPDGGVARLRVHGEVVADPRVLDAIGLDLAAAEHGGRVLGCSDQFYGSPANLLLPGSARTMGEGWETARRRGGGNDWVTVRLAASGRVRLAELDTSYFLHNAPGWASLHGAHAPRADEVRADGGDGPPEAAGEHIDGVDWVELLPRTRLQPDTRHRFVPSAAADVTHVRLDVFPDGGMARLRLWGSLSETGRRAVRDRWARTTPRQAVGSGGGGRDSGTVAAGAP